MSQFLPSTGWLAARLPHIPERSAYQAIKIFQGIDAGMFANFANIKESALLEVAKAEPDIQALIAERVEAGEIFTAAELRMRATRRLDQMRQAQKETVGLNRGLKGKVVTGVTATPVKDDRPTLAEAGIDKNLAKEGRRRPYPRAAIFIRPTREPRCRGVQAATVAITAA